MHIRTIRRVPHRKLSAVELAYISGFFDGEGYCGCGVGKWNTITVQFCQRTREVLNWIQARVGGNIYIRPVSKSNPGGAHTLNINGYEAAVVLRRMFPYLIVKRTQAYTALVLFYKQRRGTYRWPPTNTRERRRRMKMYPTDRHKLNVLEREMVKKLVDGGLTHREVASRFHVSKSTITKCCHGSAGTDPIGSGLFKARTPHHPVPVED